jgi:hypothetical protein
MAKPTVKTFAPKTVEKDIIEIKETMYHVRDMNAKDTERTHDLRNQKTNQITPVKFPVLPDAVALPESLALPLIPIEGFEVRTLEGQVLRSRKGSEQSKQYQLRPDECVARFSEMTVEGLHRVCTEEGVPFKAAETKANLIRKLLAQPLEEGAVEVINDGKDITVNVEDIDFGEDVIELDVS